MKKKVFKIFGIVFLVVIATLIAAPFFLKGKITDIIKNKVNHSVDATFDFRDANLSLFSSFPNAKVSLENISLVNKTPFEGDTLFSSNSIELEMSIKELFKDANEPITVKSLAIDKALLNILVNEKEEANYDISKGEKEESNTTNSGENSGFSFSMNSYTITNTDINYIDKSTGISLMLKDMNHSGSGDLSLATSELDTHTDALVSFEMDSTNYLNNNKIKLDAIIGIDLEKSKYTFLKNKALINQLPLVFHGFIQVNENNQELDITFKTPSSDFKNFLALIPEVYSKDIGNVKTSGDFTVEGAFNGVVDDTHIPKFNIAIASHNASFKYPDLPKTVQDINIDVAINNDSGIAEDTYIDINKGTFRIDEDTFSVIANIKELMGNTKVNAKLKGIMNLANISKAYPVPSDLDLQGLLNADISTAFDMASVEQEKYENTKTQGTLQLKDFVYKSSEVPNPIKLNTTSVTFNPKTVTLNTLEGKTGKTDFKANGTIDNLLGFMFNEDKVEGNFNLNSNTFALDDFMVAEEEMGSATSQNKTTEPGSGEEKIKIPSFLDCTINADAKTVLYDNLTLTNVKGSLKIKDEKATLNNMTSSMLGGKVGFGGQVSTKQDIPTFAMQLDLDKLGIAETFKSLELFKVLAPIASALQGKLDSNIEISGNLTDDFTPDLGSISGNVLAELLSNDIDPNKAKLLSSLTSNLSFLKLEDIDLKGVKTALTFEDGKVKVKPFFINYKDIKVNVSGGHNFDSSLDYKATLDVPAKYLGTEVTSLISKIDDSSLENLTIPVTANIGGLYNSPKVSTDMTSGVKSLTTKLMDIQKQKLINKGKDKAKDLLSDVLGGSASENDTTQSKDKTKEGVKEVLGGILGGSKQKESSENASETKVDSTAAPKKEKDVIKEKAKNILGGLLGGKKKEE
ncbi:AsmA-like C-terminal region-containing protein [uncultured Maribacter sp.]|uniref:AsmA-like C-terminal region-containing protein n=1 Tax=uncultured Maribacter sp. TaxID=431308 RepID=UPI002627638E|nr:AsmA-like C-terminal region-containing protein [uncultured Maribacter sp.]